MKINKTTIDLESPTYFIADIAANHDGDLERAKDLIWLAKESGADCAKFQHFLAEKIVSDYGFSQPNMKISHQEGWKDSVYNIYKKYHTRRDWTDDLIETCKKAQIEFMTTPYDLEAIESFKDKVNCFKIGSGDITYKELLLSLKNTKKPLILATGASTLDEIKAAIELIGRADQNICIMQCNTNYTGSKDNFSYQNLNVLKTFQDVWPNIILGLSDHTPGSSCVLGAISLGAKIVEKHFTDDNSRVGPDHDFAMNPISWKEMVMRARELEEALGSTKKKIEANEFETVIIQRRSIRLNKNVSSDSILNYDDLCFLRPCPKGALSPMNVDEVIGKTLNKNKLKGQELYWEDLN